MGLLGCGAARPCPPALGGAGAIRLEGSNAVMPLALPQASQWSAPHSIVVVERALNGELRLSGDKVEGEAALEQRLRRERARHPDAALVIKADQRAQYQAVIRLLDLARQAGFETVAFAVEPVDALAPPPSPATDSEAGASDGAELATLPRPSSPYNCGFPPAPDAPRSATVDLVVAVDERGKPRWVQIIRDPGYGFGQAAIACALGASYEPARNRRGEAVSGLSPRIRIRFEAEND